MNGFKAVIDTNIIFMSLYNPKGKAGKIIGYATENKLTLFATESVKQELSVVLKRELSLDDSEIKFIIDSLPITWIEKEIYQSALKKTKVKHKPDKPTEALSLILDCGILSADTDFDNIKNKINVNNLLEKIGNST